MRTAVLARGWIAAGTVGLRIAHICCLGLLLTLAWGPHWPFSTIGIVAPPAGLLNAGFDVADLLLVGILGGWALALVTGRDRLRLHPYWISAPLLLFCAAAALAIRPAQDHAAAIHFAVRTACLGALYLYLLRALASGRLAPPAIAIWLAPGMGLNGLLAIGQTIHNDPLGLRWLGEPGMLRTTFGTAVVQVHGEPVLRAYGVLPHPNVLGGLLAAALPLVIGPFVAASREPPGGRSRARGVWRDLLLLVCLALMAAGLVLSFSRSAWLGLLAGGAYYLSWRRGERGRPAARTLLAGACIALMVAAALLIEWDAVRVRLWPVGNQLEQFSIQQRLTLLEASFKVIAQHPLTGVGGGNVAHDEAAFLPRGASTPLPVHNTYLLAQAELGVLGTVAWLTLMWMPLLRRALQKRRSARAPGCAPPAQERGIGARDRSPGCAQAARWHALAGCSLIVVAVVGLLDFYIWVNEPTAVLWTVALAAFATGTGESAASHPFRYRARDHLSPSEQ